MINFILGIITGIGAGFWINVWINQRFNNLKDKSYRNLSQICKDYERLTNDQLETMRKQQKLLQEQGELIKSLKNRSLS